MSLQDKIQQLYQHLAAYDRLAVAFSGGVDSSFLLLAAYEALGRGSLAVTLSGPHFSPDEQQEARIFCEKHGIPQLVINIEDALPEEFLRNPPNRCYYCKKAMFQALQHVTDDIPIADGTNADDETDYRPGRQALQELGILSPLAEVGFHKDDIRRALAAMNEPVWEKPACACLASRIPYGDRITRDKMQAIYQAEHALRSLGFRQVRVRHHGSIARIEVPRDEMPRLFDLETIEQVNRLVKEAGFAYATLDLGGYIRGSLNREL